VIVSLLGGLVLGPEVALLFTGSVIGTAMAPRLGVATKTGALAGGGGALIALFIGPAFGGAAGPDYTYAVGDSVAAVIAAVAACALITVARLIGLAGPRDRVSGVWLVGGGLAVGVIAAVYQSLSDESVQLILTSGEQMIKPLLALDSTSLIAVTVAAKMAAYGLSMAAGFRGGPYFPAMFAGAGSGAIAAATLNAAPDAAVTAGIVAAVTYLAHANWKFTAILGLVLGFLVGGWQLAPVGLIAAGIGRAIPRLDPPPAVTSPT
jgi:H+/Cl- antiporter ClcA